MTKLYKLQGAALVSVPGGRLATEDMIQRWVAEQPTLLGLDILVIGREVVTEFGGRIDILGIDADGGHCRTEARPHASGYHRAGAGLRELGPSIDHAKGA
jgi:hypothetical protein